MLIVYISSMAAVTLQQQSWMLMTETIWLEKPKILTIWPFTEKVGRNVYKFRNKKTNPLPSSCL